MGLHIFFLVLYVSLSGTIDPVMMCSLLILHCIVKIIADIRQGKRGLHVMTTFYIGLILTTFADAWFINKIDNYGVAEYSMYRYIIQASIPDAVKMWTIGNTFIFMGYELFATKSFASIRVDIKNPRIIKNLYNFILFFALLNLSGNAINLSYITGGLQKVLSLLNIMGILFFARLWVTENNRKYRTYAVTLAVLQTTIALFVSFLRIELLTPSIAFFGGYFIAKGDIRYILSYRIVPPIVILIIFSLFFRTLAGNRSHFISAFTADAPQKFNSSYTVGDGTGGDEGGLLERSANIAQLTNVMHLVDKNGTYNGRASEPLLAAFIPRFLWPDKPKVQLGAWFALEIGAASIGETGRANNSINMSIPGELYLDFGWIGLAIGALLFGGLVAAFWNAARFNDSSYNLTGALWGGYLLLYALAGIGSDLQIVVSLISTYLVFLFIKRLSKAYEGTLNRAAVAG